MIQNPVYIVDIIEKVVADFTADLLPIIQANETKALGRPSNIQTISYHKGHFEELIQTLAQNDASPQYKVLKYPLVYVVQDFGEDRGEEVGLYATVPLRIAIIHQTVDTYKVDDRYAKVFKPVLYPIYYALLNGFAESDMVNENSDQIMRHRKWDRLFWGTQSIGGTSKNTLNDYVDAIELTNLRLSFLYNNC